MKALLHNKTLTALLLGTGCLLGLASTARASLMIERGNANPTSHVELPATVNFTLDNNTGGPFGTLGNFDGDADGATDKVGTPVDLDPAAGTIVLGNQTIGGLMVGGATIFSIHSPNLGFLSDNAAVKNNSSTTVELLVYIGDTDFVFPNGGTMVSSASATITGGSIRIITWDDALNKQFGGDTVRADNPSIGAFHNLDVTFSAGFNLLSQHSFSMDGTPTAFGPGTYSKTIFYDIRLLPKGFLTSVGATIGDVATVPEPSTPMLVLTALPLLSLGGLVLRRKRSLPTAA